jgi:LysM repeat protein
MQFDICVIWIDKSFYVVDKKYARKWRPATSRKKRQNMYLELNAHKSIITQLETDLKSIFKLKYLRSYWVCCFKSPFLNPVFAQENQTYPEYVIQSGDTLIGIASLFKVSVGEITELNNIEDSNQIFPAFT